MNKKLTVAMTFFLAITHQQIMAAESQDVKLANKTQVVEPLSTNNQLEPEIKGSSSVKSWLALQPSGSQASKYKQTLSGPVLDKVYDRYTDSFSRPIPPLAEQRVRKNN